MTMLYRGVLGGRKPLPMCHCRGKKTHIFSNLKIFVSHFAHNKTQATQIIRWRLRGGLPWIAAQKRQGGPSRPTSSRLHMLIVSIIKSASSHHACKAANISYRGMHHTIIIYTAMLYFAAVSCHGVAYHDIMTA